MANKTHRDLYPQQYTHPLVGRTVEVANALKVRGVVERVVPSRFGQLVILRDDDVAYRVSDCKLVNKE